MNFNINNAYLLFYERNTYYNEDFEEIDMMYDGIEDIHPSLKRKMSQQDKDENDIILRIHNENEEYLTKNYLFDNTRDFSRFIENVLTNII